MTTLEAVSHWFIDYDDPKFPSVWDSLRKAGVVDFNEGEGWQYMGTVETNDGRQWHQFRNRGIPGKGRCYRNTPA